MSHTYIYTHRQDVVRTDKNGVIGIVSEVAGDSDSDSSMSNDEDEGEDDDGDGHEDGEDEERSE